MRNRREVTIDGTAYELEASILASDVYADEFCGSLREPYSGILEDDMLVTYNRSRPTVTAFVKADKKGNPVKGKDGQYTVVDSGGVGAEVPNKDYRGIDAVALLRYLWAMGVAAGSIEESWADFGERMEHVDFVVREMAQAFSTVVFGLGGGCIFRDPTRLADSEQPDEGQQADGEPSD